MTQTPTRPRPSALAVTAPVPAASPAGARSFTEYLVMFALTESDLRGRRLLDTPAGAAAFAAGALARGLDAVAVDPGYPSLEAAERGAALAELGLLAVTGAEAGHTVVEAEPHRFTWTYFTGPEDLRRRRVAAARYFGAHAAEHPERYVPGAVAALPFDDGAFDVVLSSHLPPAEDLGAALRELLRVARQEVRVYPAVHPALEETLAALDGITAERRPTRYAFAPGCTDVLVLRKD